MPVKQEVLDRVVGSVTEIVGQGGNISPENVGGFDDYEPGLPGAVAHLGNTVAMTLKAKGSKRKFVPNLISVFKQEKAYTQDELLEDFTATLAGVLSTLAYPPDYVHSTEEATMYLKVKKVLPKKFHYNESLMLRAMALADALPKE